MYYTTQVKVMSYDCDLRNQIKISSAMRYMQQTAGEHLNWLGFPIEQLYAEDLVFLMTKICIKVHSMPKIHEELTVGTAAITTKGVRFVREFVIDNSEGDRLISAISYWPLVKPSSRKILRPKDFDRDLVFQKPGVAEYIDDIPLPKKVEIGDDESYVERIGYSKIDINDHVNNSIYADIISDAVPYDVMSKEELDTFTIGFQNEAVHGDSIVIRSKEMQNKEYYILGQHERAECFKGLITFK